MIRKTLLALSLAAALVLTIATGQTAFGAPKAPSNTIVDVAVANGNFKTLVTALTCTGLVPTLNGRGQHTVFAPTDAAFAKDGLNTSNVCSAFSKATLTNILLYHVAHGARYSGDVASSTQIRMLNGEFTRVSTQGGHVYINNAKILIPDVSASNGVIHVIDTVLLP